MSQLQILRTSIPTEKDTWLGAWRDDSEREPFAHPAYVQLFARPTDAACCAYLTCAHGVVMFPFILRPVAVEPWGEGSTMQDIISPYGYGGAFAQGDHGALAEAFWPAFERWAVGEHVVTMFARLSLFSDQLLPFGGTTIEKGLNIVGSVQVDDHELWSQYRHKVRKNVNRATREGVTVVTDANGERLDDFLTIYHGTMDRRKASQGYYFNRSFFETIVQSMQGSFMFFHALHSQQVVSTELALVSTSHVYSFLGGTREESFELRPNDLIKHEIMRWARDAGKTHFVFGGGYEPNDGIYTYKKAFAPEGETPFRVGQAVFDPSALNELIERRAGYEASHGGDWIPNEGYFPAYRA